MRKVWFIISIISILLNQIHSELIAGHIIFTNGVQSLILTDTTNGTKPVKGIHKSSELTDIGIDQQYRLGQYIRTRYGSLLKKQYTRHDIYVRSADYDISLMSAQSNLIGLYPLPEDSQTKIPIQSVPIHTVPINQDFLLGLGDCSKLDKIQNDRSKTDYIKNILKYFDSVIHELQDLTNKTISDIESIIDLVDSVFVKVKNSKTGLKVNTSILKSFTDLESKLLTAIYGHDEIKRIRGGPMIQEIWNNINRLINRQSYFKVKMYSTIDATITAVLAFLDIDYTFLPTYAGAIFVDLYKQDTNYFVKVEYLNVTDSNTAYPITLKDCSGVQCPFEKFTSLYQPRFPKNVEAECKIIPPVPISRINSMKVALVCLIIAVVVLAVIVILLIIANMSRKDEYNQPLISNEASSLTR